MGTSVVFASTSSGMCGFRVHVCVHVGCLVSAFHYVSVGDKWCVAHFCVRAACVVGAHDNVREEWSALTRVHGPLEGPLCSHRGSGVQTLVRPVCPPHAHHPPVPCQSMNRQIHLGTLGVAIFDLHSPSQHVPSLTRAAPG